MKITKKIKQFFLKEDKNIVKVVKPVKSIEYPAKVLIIDNNLYNYKDEICRQIFSSEEFNNIDNNLCKFEFAKCLSEASTRIQLEPPDLIVCNSSLPWEDMEMILKDANKGQERQQQYTKSFAYVDTRKFGLNVFQVVENLDLNYDIPILFWSFTSTWDEIHKEVKDLGAIDSLEHQDSSCDNLLIAIKKVLKL